MENQLKADSFHKIRPITWAVSAFFLAMAADCANISGIGSVLKVIALIPTFFALIDLKMLRIRAKPLLVVLIAFFLLAMVSCVYTINLEYTLPSVVSLGMNIGLIVLVGAMETYSEREIRVLKTALLYGSWLTAFFMCINSGMTQGRLSLSWGANSAADENGINGYLFFALAYHAVYFFQKRKIRHALLCGGLYIIMLCTGSRGALLAGVAVGISAWWLTRKEKNRTIRDVGLLILCIAVLAGVVVLSKHILPESVLERFTYGYYKEHGTTGRFKTWRAMLQHYEQDSVFRQLFGHGYATSRLLNSYNGLVAHNLYLDNMMTIGLVGVLVQIVIQGCCIYALKRRGEIILLCGYIGFIVMCMSLSLVNYKPIWNVMVMAFVCSNMQIPKPACENR